MVPEALLSATSEFSNSTKTVGLSHALQVQGRVGDFAHPLPSASLRAWGPGTMWPWTCLSNLPRPTHVQDPGAQRSFQSKHLGAQGQAANRGGPVPSPAPGRRGG